MHLIPEEFCASFYGKEMSMPTIIVKEEAHKIITAEKHLDAI
jgi:hypothetical protein